MPKLPNGLTPLQQAFIPAYIASGFNATQAYLKIKPSVTYETAMNNSSRLLRDEQVAQALSDQFSNQRDKSIATRGNLTLEAHEVYEKAWDKELLGTCLSAIELKGKLNRVFTEDVPEMENYKVLMQSLTVNVQTNPGNDRPAKDITPLDVVDTQD